MGGIIDLTAGVRWSVGQSSFNFVLDYLIGELADDAAAEVLKEIDDENLKRVSIDEFEPAQRVRILTLLRDGFLPHAVRRLSLDPLDPSSGAVFRELSEMARVTLIRARQARRDDVVAD